jgi:flagellar basal-body rod protein FlgC
MSSSEIFSGLNIAASGLTAHREWMDLIAGNIANAETTETPEGGPFRRQLAVFMENQADSGQLQGVKVKGIVDDQSELRKVYEPSHPNADAQGYVAYPNVNVVTEMVDMIAASRAYEANATVLEALKGGFMRALQTLQA